VCIVKRAELLGRPMHETGILQTEDVERRATVDHR
jgi:hypothetical protein